MSASIERDHLVALQREFPPENSLSSIPTELAKTIQNAQAYARAMHLALYDYPVAFTTPPQEFDTGEEAWWFRRPHMTTYALGNADRVLAGITIARFLTCGWSDEYDNRAVRLRNLFRVREQDDALIGSGKRLLHRALGDVASSSCERVSLHVMLGNSKAHGLYARVGFEPDDIRVTPQGTLVEMAIEGNASIRAAEETLAGMIEANNDTIGIR